MRSTDFLHLMGIDVWRERQPATVSTPLEKTLQAPPEPAPAAAAQNVTPSTITASSGTHHILTAWRSLQQRVATCTSCPLYKTRTQGVLGAGNRQAELMLVGEAPGAQEDRQGEPFVGEAGKLLNKILAAVQLKPEQIYITNILKSRPPENRNPQPAEIAACTPFLLEQITLVNPKLIVALGRISAHYLLQSKLPLGKLRGTTFYYSEQKIPLLATYHPAYLLRNPIDKRKAWEDWQHIKATLATL